MKKQTILMLCFCISCSIVYSEERPQFDREKDILIAQYDIRDDPDDLQSAAALGSMLAHKELEGVKVFAVHGAYGIQKTPFFPSHNLFNLIFGEQDRYWTDAHTDWNGSVDRIKEKAKPVLLAGGQVWVPEAGQSDFTYDWVKALIMDGLSETVIKERVIVVQHSPWNENHTASNKLVFVKHATNYRALEDGNFKKNEGRGPDTPAYRSADKLFREQVKSSPNERSKTIWQGVDRQLQSNGYFPDYSVISKGGLDFSDTVECWWIFNASDADSVEAFWKKYVINSSEE